MKPYFALRSYRDECEACGGDGQARPGVEAAPALPTQPNNNGLGKSSLGAAKGPGSRAAALLHAEKMKATFIGTTDGCPACNGTGRAHYDGQLGSEATPGEFIDNLIACTADWLKVLKPTGSLFVNLGDKYAGSGGHNNAGLAKPHTGSIVFAGQERNAASRPATRRNAPDRYNQNSDGIPAKSRMGLPWRYALRCIDELGLILRADIIWAKPNGLPESVTDRVRISHEYLFHFTRQGRYYASVDEIREPHLEPLTATQMSAKVGSPKSGVTHSGTKPSANEGDFGHERMLNVTGSNPLGKVPGSVWTISSEPLQVPDHLGVDHFACLDDETEILTRRGWLHHNDLTADDEAAGRDLDTGVASWTRIHGIHRYDFDGELIAVEARGLSMRLTPNHRTLAHRHAGRHRTRQALEVIDAADLTKNHAIPRAVDWRDDGREKAIGSDFAALLGWVAAEGWYAGRRVYLSQSMTANPVHVATIDALIARLGGALRSERFRTRRHGATHDVQWRLNDDLGERIRLVMPAKLLPTLDLPREEGDALLDAFIDGDGHRRADGRIAIFQKLRHNLDVLQAIAVRLGYNTTLAEHPTRWVLYLNPPRPARLRRSDGTSLVTSEHYRGTVWCVTTGTGTFVARRRGTVFVTGNSYPSELVRRIILGWTPNGYCTACGEARRAIVDRQFHGTYNDAEAAAQQERCTMNGGVARVTLGQTGAIERTITGYACACTPYTDHPAEEYILTGTDNEIGVRPPWREYHFAGWTPAPTTPATVVDPFVGTGTTCAVAHHLGRHGIGTDLSNDYLRLAEWRSTHDHRLRDKVLERAGLPAAPKIDGQLDLFGTPA